MGHGETVGVAPGRVNLMGEHLDYLGGRCLSIALTQRTQARVRLRDDERLIFHSENRHWRGGVADLSPGRVTGWAAYVAGVLWAMDVRQGLDIQISSGLPIGAGLSSSAALACCVAIAVNASLGLGYDAPSLAQACHRSETEMVGAPTGALDQTVSIFARSGHALLVDFSTDPATREQIPFQVSRAEVALVVIDTGVTHDMRTSEYGTRRRECATAARRLSIPKLAEIEAVSNHARRRLPEVLRRRAAFVASELTRVDHAVRALREQDWCSLGELMKEGHRSARDDFEISCAELDLAVKTAGESGALGARMTGGGFGGSAIALVERQRVPAVERAIRRAFREQGWVAPRLFTSVAGPGARVL